MDSYQFGNHKVKMMLRDYAAGIPKGKVWPHSTRFRVMNSVPDQFWYNCFMHPLIILLLFHGCIHFECILYPKIY